MSNRQSSFELLRILAAAGIVWFHAAVQGSQIGYTGLTVFLILTPLFDLGANFARRTPWIEHARRLLVPFAFWSAIYAAANVVKGKPVLNMDHGIAMGLLAGPSIHLWYLPFMAAALAIIGALKERLEQKAVALLAVAMLPLTLAALHFGHDAADAAGLPLPQWLHAITPFVIGMICGANSKGMPRLRLVAAMLLVGALILWRELSVVQFLAGLVLIEIAGTIRWNDERVNRLAGLMMGVYLVHPLALTVFRPIEPYSQAAFVLAAFGASALGTMMAARITPDLSARLLGTPRPRTAT